MKERTRGKNGFCNAMAIDPKAKTKSDNW